MISQPSSRLGATLLALAFLAPATALAQRRTTPNDTLKSIDVSFPKGQLVVAARLDSRQPVSGRPRRHGDRAGIRRGWGEAPPYSAARVLDR